MAVQKNRVIMTVTALLSLIALVGGLFVAKFVYLPKKMDLSKFQGTYLQQPRTINSFLLTGVNHKPFSNENLKGHWTMVFFGFTNCGYLCPTTMAELGKMYRMLEKKGIKNLPQVVMISIDPKRDDLAKLGSYVTAFDSHFYGARGSSKAIKNMTQEMGIAYSKVVGKDKKDSENYDIQHSGAVILVNPKGELAAFFTSPHQAKQLAEDYSLLVS